MDFPDIVLHSLFLNAYFSIFFKLLFIFKIWALKKSGF